MGSASISINLPTDYSRLLGRSSSTDYDNESRKSADDKTGRRKKETCQQDQPKTKAQQQKPDGQKTQDQPPKIYYLQVPTRTTRKRSNMTKGGGNRTKTTRQTTVQTTKDKQRSGMDPEELPDQNQADRHAHHLAQETLDMAVPQIIITPPVEEKDANPRLDRQPRQQRQA